MDLRETERYWRTGLPHWEIKDGVYFITLRVVDSMPREAQRKLDEERISLETIEARSEAFLEYQRNVFRLCEKYLDSGYGYCPFEEENIARTMRLEIINSCQKDLWEPLQFCIMPNHVHLIAGPANKAAIGLEDFVKRLKGRSSFRINRKLGRRGRFWQIDWFDRWIRDRAELKRVEDYVRNNPKKARLPERYRHIPYQ